jgi:hypothetical protein
MFGITVGTVGIWLLLLLIWTIPWKGYALWLAARNDSPWWFIILLVVNTVGILEIIYIFFVGRPLQKKLSAAESSEAADSKQ